MQHSTEIHLAALNITVPRTRPAPRPVASLSVPFAWHDRDLVVEVDIMTRSSRARWDEPSEACEYRIVGVSEYVTGTGRKITSPDFLEMVADELNANCPKDLDDLIKMEEAGYDPRDY